MTMYDTPEGRFPSRLMIDGELVDVPAGTIKQGSEPNGGNCVGFGWINGKGVIIDTKNPEGGSLQLTPDAFRAFIAAIRDPAFAVS